MVAIEPLFIVALAGIMVFDIRRYLFGLLALNVVAFFVITHGVPWRARAAAARPRSTSPAFYMWMSAGGVIGGIFAGLIAPNIFSWVLEYPALIVLAILCRPGLRNADRHAHAAALARRHRGRRRSWRFPASTERYVADEKTFNWTIGAMLVVAGLVSREPLPFAAVIAVVFIIGQAYRAGQRNARNDAQLLRRAQDHRNGGRPRSACSCTAPRSTAPSGCATMMASRSPDRRR